MSRKSVLDVASLLLGAAIAYFGAFFGNATSATERYGGLLRFWASATVIAVLLLGALAITKKGWVRYTAAALIAVTAIAGIDPLTRLEELGWSGP